MLQGAKARWYKIEIHPLPSKNIDSNSKGQSYKELSRNTACDRYPKSSTQSGTLYKHLTHRPVHAVTVILLAHLYCSLHYRNEVLKD